MMPRDAISAGQARPVAVGIWLCATAFMVVAMMLIGAITRLTESGLSMVELRPLIGAVPPLSLQEWERVFDLYKQTSQYRLLNQGMSLVEFQEIFFWEWFHRFWGRLIGLVYGLPFFYFIIRRRIPSGYARHLWVLLILGGMQGLIGMWMVESGFVDRVEVSQYRLAVHLGMAFVILGYVIWLALGLLWPVEPGRMAVPRNFRRLGAWCHAVLFVTVLSGALVAGMNAGMVYNEWPTMGGSLIPDDYWNADLGGWSLVENITAVQFNHRTLAYLTVLIVAGFWLRAQFQQGLSVRLKRAIHALFGMVILQATIGIATLLSVVWLPLAVLHQAGAIMSFCLALWCLKELRG